MNSRKSNRICVRVIPVAKMTQDLMKKQDFQILLNFLNLFSQGSFSL